MRANEISDTTVRPGLLARRLGTIVVTVLQALAVLAVSVALLPYVVVPVYMFHPLAPFGGASLFNPYAGMAACEFSRALPRLGWHHERNPVAR